MGKVGVLRLRVVAIRLADWSISDWFVGRSVLHPLVGRGIELFCVFQMVVLH